VLIARFLELANPPRQMIFMLQKEMGERLAAQPGKGSYGALSVRVQQLYDVKILRIVPPEVFYPPPKVDSAIVSFELKQDLPSPKLVKHLSKLVKHAFEQRRKMLAGALAMATSKHSKAEIAEKITEAGLSPDIRGEKLSLADFARLSDILEM
jgi:16S rRNA (adenine1518-N6/adenine1519-N6)-dimethyltransferase